MTAYQFILAARALMLVSVATVLFGVRPYTARLALYGLLLSTIAFVAGYQLDVPSASVDWLLTAFLSVVVSWMFREGHRKAFSR